jgi:hypothetical protein
MLYLNANEEKRLVFEVEIHGVETKDLRGSVRFMLHGVEYGFPAEIESKKIVALIPPLTEVVGKDIEDGTIMEGRLDLFTDRHYFKPWEGEIKLGAPMQIRARLESEDKSKFGIKTKLVNPVISEDTPSKREPVVEKKQDPVPTLESEMVRKAVLSVMREMGIGDKKTPTAKPSTTTPVRKPQQQLKKVAPVVREAAKKSERETVHDFLQEKMMSISQPAKVKRQQPKKVITREDINNVTEDQITAYMERAGTRNPQVQEIIMEQARQGATNNFEILRNVVKIIKRKS